MHMTVETLLMNRAILSTLPPVLQSNAHTLAERITALEAAIGQCQQLTSGYRRLSDNLAAGGASHSLHMECAAADLADPDGALWQWCLENMHVLNKIGLWVEHPNWTHSRTDPAKRWVHFQIFAPHSGNRVFVPSSAPALWPEFWTGVNSPAWN